MKKQICTLLSLIMLLCVACIPASAQTDWDYICDFDGNLDGYPIDRPIYQSSDKSWISYYANTAEASVKGEGIYEGVYGIGGKASTDRSLRIANTEDLSIWGANSTTNNYVRKNFSAQSIAYPNGKLHFSFFTMIRDDLATRKEIALSISTGSLSVKFETDGYVYFYNNGSWVKGNLTYEPNTPYQVDVIADLTSEEVKLYLNGRSALTTKYSGLANAAAVTRFEIVYPRTLNDDGTDVISDVVIDDICYKSFPAETTVAEIESRLPEAEKVKTTIFANDFSGGMKGEPWHTPVGFTYMYKSHDTYYPDTTTDTVGGVGAKDAGDLSFVVTTKDLVNRKSTYSNGDPTWDPFLLQQFKTTVTETTVLSVDVYLADLNSQRWIDLRKRNSEGYNMVLIEKDGTVYSNNTPVATVYPYTWNRFAMVMTPGSNKYTLYMNGRQIGSDLTYTQEFDGYIQDMKLTTMFTGAVNEDETEFIKPQSGVTAWDNVELYTINGTPDITAGPVVTAVEGAVVDAENNKVYVASGTVITADMVTASEGASVSLMSGAGEAVDSAVSGDYICVTDGDMFGYYRLSGAVSADYEMDWNLKALTVTAAYKLGLPDAAPTVIASWETAGEFKGAELASDGKFDESASAYVYEIALDNLADADKVNVYIWDGVDTMNPIFGSHSIEKAE